MVFDKKSYTVSTRLFSDVEAFIDEHYVAESLAEEYSGYLPQALLDGVQTTQLYEDADSTYILDFEPRSDRNLRESAPPPPMRVRPLAHMEEKNLRTSAVLRSAEPTQELDSYLQNIGHPLSEHLQQLINKKRMTNAEVYKRANMGMIFLQLILLCLIMDYPQW